MASAPSLAANVSATPPAETATSRLVSLDAFRGATMALMVLVNTPGGRRSYGPLNHSEWNGWTVTDMVFPSFLWIVGVAITLSLGQRIASGVRKSRLFLQVLRRAAVIFGLGLVFYAAPNFNLPVDDIQIHPRENDLILATHGRSIWILDSISPLEQMN